jgi:tetratricopeptide (TPR) repeat protein
MSKVKTARRMIESLLKPAYLSILLSFFLCICAAQASNDQSEKSDDVQAMYGDHPSAQISALRAKDPVIADYKQYKLSYLKSVIEQYTVAIAAHPNQYTNYRRRGLAYWKMQEYPEAEKDLQKAIATGGTKTNSDVYGALGDCYAAEEKYKEGIPIFTKALEIQPLRILYLNRRAQLYFSIGDYKNAIKDADRLVELVKGDTWALDFRARVQFGAGNYQKAVDDCTESIKRSNKSIDPYVTRNKAYTKLGKTELAQKDRKRVDELVPGSSPP